MIDEINVIKIKSNDGKREIELRADYNGFIKLYKLTGNPFFIMDEFAKSTKEGLVFEYEHLPTIMCAMTSEDISVEEIRTEFLGMSWRKVNDIAAIVNALIFSELTSEIEVDFEKKSIAPVEEVQEK